MIEYLYFNNGGGVAAGDINNDGLTDLYFTASQLSNKLYLNKGNFKFEDITDQAGVGGNGDWTTGVTMGDVNGDGFLDIYVCYLGDYKGKQGQNQLFINNGDNTFTDKAESFGLNFQGFSTQAAFFDYDLDGDLDMYLLNHSVHSTRSYGRSSIRFQTDSKSGDRLFRQDRMDGKIRYLDVSQRAGILSSHIGYGLGVAIADLNSDGYPDIYISNDFHENDYLYLNQGNGTFKEQFTKMMRHASRSSMGNDVADFNNDGRLDVVVLDMLPAEEQIRKRSGGEEDYEIHEIKRSYGYHPQFVRNMLQLNMGNQFSEIGRLAGIESTDWSWAPLFCDMDNDGYKDLYITNGIYRRANDLDYVKFLLDDNNGMRQPNSTLLSNKELYEKMPLDPLINYAFQNNGDLTFTSRAMDWGMDIESYSNGAIYADLDNDGDLDIIVNNINEKAFVFRNNSGSLNKNHFVVFKCTGSGKNKFGIGARISIHHQKGSQIVENNLTRGFMSSVPPEIHFGLGEDILIDSAIILWPGGYIEKMYNVEVDQVIEANIENAVSEHQSNDQSFEYKKLFELDTIIPGLDFIHKENKFTEFKDQYLTPHELSSEGPGIAVGDVNADGKEDVYIGGAKGQRPALFIQEEKGFSLKKTEVFQIDYGFEDTDAVLVDVDGDLDLDLYVVSGGNERTIPDRLMTDRLYLNHGNGEFTRSVNKLPEFYHNGSCVVPADFDNDNDIDLFVGSRSIPNAYGISPDSYLLENDGAGNFSDVTNKKAAGLLKLGMVTDAVWTDYDLDHDVDLIIVGEWMNIAVFKNNEGILQKQDDVEGLENTSGWWFSVEADDLDNDGDTDLIAGNLGLNTLHKTSPKEPIKMYLNDFDRNGTIDQIITYTRNGVEYMTSSKDELGNQLNYIKNTYPDYADFAGMSLHDVFSGEQLDASIIKSVNCFETSVFINDAGIFKKVDLPLEVQFSPVKDMMVHDFDGDNLRDVLLAGNFNAVRPSYGRYNASYGWFLKGLGNGDFDVLYPLESGFLVHGEVRHIKEIYYDNRKYILIARNNASVVGFEFIVP
jgi:hypothetical protein